MFELDGTRMYQGRITNLSSVVAVKAQIAVIGLASD